MRQDPDRIYDKETLKAIALGLKEMRNERNIAQDQFFFDTGIHIARIETGNVPLTFQKLETICKHLDVNVVDLLSKIPMRDIGSANNNALRIAAFEMLWTRRNPKHEVNSNSGANMFYQTALCVADEFAKLKI